MRKLFYAGAISLTLFEILKVYFIMPMPGSQEVQSIDLAYFLHTWRWLFRLVFAAFMLAGGYQAYQSRRWLMLVSLFVVLAVIWAFNFRMVADKMFYQPGELLMADAASNTMPPERLVLGLHLNGESRAYPIQLIAYHHQVLDTVAGKPIMVTYCSVCRTGRIFEPRVQGSPESFRLVGMDHFNAMFEDHTTKSWWRQANGEAIAGPLKGTVLPELLSEQTTLKQWLALYPNSLVMQPDSSFAEEYESLEDYDFGIDRGELTRTDTLSWMEKSWVVGVEVGDSSLAIDWNQLKEERIIHFTLDGQPLFVALASDDQSFFAFERPANTEFILENDTLLSGDQKYHLSGYPESEDVQPLKRVRAYQEFWHSWRTFHPDTRK